jgi:hypothetical protein
MEFSMKLITIITLSLISFASFGSTYTCVDKSIGYTELIEIHIEHGDVFITEVDRDDHIISSTVTSQDSSGDFTTDIASHSGYTRTLTKDGETFSIEMKDECSSSSITLSCE